VSTQLLTFCGAKFTLVDVDEGLGEGLAGEEADAADLAAAIADTGLVILSLGPRTT
jgi:hypothetical protein